MNNLKLAIRSFFKKGQNNAIKIISLGTGLAVGLLLLAKVSFEQNFDSFYPDSDQIYKIETKISRANESPKDFGQVSGAIAVGMKMEIPEVEAATRFTSITSENAVFYTSQRKKLNGYFILADSCLYDVLPRPMIVGDAKKILAQPMYAIISKSLADRIGGNVINEQIELDNYPGRKIIIGGIFEDILENSIVQYDVAVSMPSIGKFTKDGSMNWVGNDRYNGFVKLKKGTAPESIASPIRRMQEKHQNIKQLTQEWGWDINYVLNQISKIHSDSPETKRMIKLISILAFALIFTAVMNYMLIVISSLTSKAKSVAVNKCYGATETNITRQMMAETALHLILSLLFATLLVFIFKATIEHILSTSLSALVSLQSIVLVVVICILVFFIAAIIPAYMLSHIPVATVFRTLNKSRRSWKMALLFIQFVATSFLFTLVVTVSKQYNLMLNDNPGYNYENVVYVNTYGTDTLLRHRAIEKLKQLPQVQKVALISDLPFEGMSGNNVSLPGEDKELFNFADMYYGDENYFPLMEIPVIEGKNFEKGYSVSDVMISKSFADRMVTLAGWTDGVVGKEIIISDPAHGKSPCRIRGIYSDIRLGSISNEDKRPSLISYADCGYGYVKTMASVIIIKLEQLNGDNIRNVETILKEVMPDKDIVITPYSDSMIKLYNKEGLFRQAILIGGILVIIITLIGLIGYVNNEIVRRTSEIAVRKVNGATLKEIMLLFLKNILFISFPALVIGCVIAAITTNAWLENFSLKADFSVFLYIACGLIIFILIETIVLINCIKISNQNPVDSLKSE